MTESSEPSALPAAALPYTLLRAGLIPPARFLEAVGLVRDEAFWRRWGQAALLALAVGQVLAGVVFFFAFNWAALPAFAKLGLIEAGIVLCVAGAWLGRGRPAAWSVLVTSAATLVGVLLAVFGQIYQTGADAYTLFVGWALLILPWVGLSRTLATWALWLVVAGVGGAAWAIQIAIPLGWLRPEPLAALLALFYTAALLLRELAARRWGGWLAPLWPRRLLAAAILALTGSAATPAVFEGEPGPAGWLAVAGFAVAVAGLGSWGRRMHDLPVVALAVLAGSLYLCLVGGRIAGETGDAAGGAFTFLLLVAAVFGTAFAVLRRLRAGMTAHG